MSDLISRQAAIDKIKEIYEWHDNVSKERIIEHFKRLPSVTPQNHGEMLVCPSCGLDVHSDFKYCPRCGRKMQESEKV